MATSKMSKKRLSVSFVGVFRNLISMLPVLDHEFCSQLFQQPQDTVISGLGPEGFFIRVANKSYPTIVINPQKIIFTAASNELLYSYIEAIKKKFQEIGLNMQYIAYGLNYEYEWVDLKVSSSQWLWKHFFNTNLSISDMPLTCNKVSLKTDINENEYIYTDIEPRAGIDNGIFAMVNHHKQLALETLPNKQELIQLYKESERLVEKKFLLNIIEKGE